MASAAWTIGDPGAAVRAGLVVGALAAVALTAGWVTRVSGVVAIAGLIAALAVAEAALGITSAALHHEPFAQRLGGGWRPGGTFEYPPALALLQVSALPVLIWAVVRASRRWVAIAAATGLALSGTAIVLSHSRIGVALGLVVALGTVVALTGPGRRSVVAAAAMAALVGVAGVAALSSGSAGPGAEPVSGFDHGRTEEWGVAVDAALERPLTGAGADAYVRAAAAERETGAATLYAHSLPLEAWAELGPLGLGLVAGLYLSALALVWRLRREPLALLVVPAVLAFLAFNLVDWPWHLAGAGAVWAAALGACVALSRTPRLPRPAPE